jgi:hypothetical protein
MCYLQSLILKASSRAQHKTQPTLRCEYFIVGSCGVHHTQHPSGQLVLFAVN